MNINIDSLFDFMDESNLGLTLPGFYDISKDMLRISLVKWLETGINPLIEHQELTAISWIVDYPYVELDDKQVDLIKECMSGNTFWHFDNFFEDKGKLQIQIEEHDRLKTIRDGYAYRRRVADSHISKKDLRERLFLRDGKFCSKCKSTDNISIDHIIPVIKGGGNEDNNLQVLCIPCNSSKGCK